MADDPNTQTSGGRPPIYLYAVTIHGATASNDLDRMKEMAEQAKAWLAENGDVSAALEILRAEIAKRESGGA